jgi:hypothetical protein
MEHTRSIRYQHQNGEAEIVYNRERGALEVSLRAAHIRDKHNHLFQKLLFAKSSSRSEGET